MRYHGNLIFSISWLVISLDHVHILDHVHFFLLSFQGLISLIIEKLKGDDTVLQNIIKSGKEYLYAELLYILQFGSLR